MPGEYTLEHFGAVGGDLVKDQYALEMAIEAQRTGYADSILIQNKTYYVTGATANGHAVNFRGLGSKSLLKHSGEGACLLLRSAHNSTLRNFRIQGTATGINQNGIESGYLGADGASDLYVSNVKCYDLGGRGFSWAYGEDIIGPQFDHCNADNCLDGYYGGMQGTLSGCKANQCRNRGLVAASGNVNWNGGDIIECAVGVHVTAGGNDAHGIVNGAQINHNTKAIEVDGVTNGHTFTGCHIYEGIIDIAGNRTAGMVTFEGCTIDATEYLLNESLVWLCNCRFPAGYANTWSETGTNTVFITNPRLITGGGVPGFLPVSD